MEKFKVIVQWFTNDAENDNWEVDSVYDNLIDAESRANELYRNGAYDAKVKTPESKKGYKNV